MTAALEMFRSLPRYATARLGGNRGGGIRLAPLRLVNGARRSPPGDGWIPVRPRLAGICGSDLGALSGQTSLYFSGLVSMPFIPGHEIVGELLQDADGWLRGQRVVIDPVLPCRARGIEPPCAPCRDGLFHLCERVTAGHIAPGLQTGYCADTGGGWSEMFFAHLTQLYAVPDDLSDEGAVLVEPTACAVHAVRRAEIPRDATVVIVGAGTIGLLTLVAARRLTPAGRIVVVAKHPRQAEFAHQFGASDVVPVDEALGAIRRISRSFRVAPERSAPFLLGGADIAFECAGSPSSLDLTLRAVRGRGRVVLAAMPPSADLSPAWFREIEIVGAYSGAGDFEDALSLVSEERLQDLVAASYRLERWRDALEHAYDGGALGAAKVVFDLREAM